MQKSTSQEKLLFDIIGELKIIVEADEDQHSKEIPFLGKGPFERRVGEETWIQLDSCSYKWTYSGIKTNGGRNCWVPLKMYM